MKKQALSPPNPTNKKQNKLTNKNKKACPDVGGNVAANPAPSSGSGAS